MLGAFVVAVREGSVSAVSGQSIGTVNSGCYDHQVLAGGWLACFSVRDNTCDGCVKTCTKGCNPSNAILLVRLEPKNGWLRRERLHFYAVFLGVAVAAALILFW